MLCDLHTHSTASDGQYTPAAVAEKAAALGLEVMALTDHDTLDGVPEAITAGKRLGIQVIPGIELSAEEFSNLHILGYGFREDAPHLRALCRQLVEGRNQRKYKILACLENYGICLSLEEVESLAGGRVIARPHFAQAMVNRGYVHSTREAFDRYLDSEEIRAIPRFQADACSCIAAIHADGGKASWAHPYQVHPDWRETETLACSLADRGLDAIECFYPRHTPEQTCFYCTLADRLGLHRTGGSDFHGERVKPDICLKKWELDIAWITDRN